jgi:hypothetical protein
VNKDVGIRDYFLMPKWIREKKVWETLHLEINVYISGLLRQEEEETEDATEQRAEKISDLR